ncbi:MAG: hypothetical protein A2939_02815 [Parcubacteria group bacterium RIFCSPLOWO2_01_FULL_48_18]|nr:MAG: hypothetical protein A2939_02815 [Parcubacteria group bacterium RIFCSPLOWO2_01_FULL_48_18]
MNKRFLKQVVYGLLYACIWFGVIAVVVISFRPDPTCFDDVRNQNETDVDCGGVCMPCLIKRILAPQVMWENVFPVSHSQVSVAAKIRNLNLDAGAKRFAYEFRVFGPFGIKLQSVAGESFIFPGETKYLIDVASPVDYREVTSVSLDIREIDWQPPERLPKRLALETRAITAQFMSENRFVELTGFVVNSAPVKLSRVRVKAVVFDRAGLPVLVSKTELNDLIPKEERALRMIVPSQFIDFRGVDFSHIDVEPEVIQ